MFRPFRSAESGLAKAETAEEAKGGKLGLDDVKYVVRALKEEVTQETINNVIKSNFCYITDSVLKHSSLGEFT